MAKDSAGEGSPLQDHLDAIHKAAQIHTENAKRQNIEAQTDKTRASIPHQHAQTHAERVRAMIDALSPIPHAPPMAQQPAP